MVDLDAAAMSVDNLRETINIYPTGEELGTLKAYKPEEGALRLARADR